MSRPSIPKTPLHLAALMRDPGSAAALRALCDTFDGIRLEVLPGPAMQAISVLGARNEPDAVLLEIDPGNAARGEHDVALLGEALPGAAVIATCADASVPLARRLMRLGVLDLIPQPIARDDLMAAVSSLRRRAKAYERPAESAGRIIAFLKAGGGSGATTLAVQTAATFATRGAQREPEVCLLDFDMQFGVAALALDLEDRIGLGDLLEARDRLDGALLRSVMGHHGSGLDVLAAPRTLMPLDALTVDFVTECLALARVEYRSVVLDLPLAWTVWSHAALKQCDLMVLVTRLDVPGIRRARRQLDALAANGLSDVPLRLALNRHARSWGARTRRHEAEQALGRPFDFIIGEDAAAFGESFNRGVPLAKVARWSRANRDLRRLADGIALALAKGAGEPSLRRPPGARLAISEVSRAC